MTIGFNQVFKVGLLAIGGFGVIGIFKLNRTVSDFDATFKRNNNSFNSILGGVANKSLETLGFVVTDYNRMHCLEADDGEE